MIQVRRIQLTDLVISIWIILLYKWIKTTAGDRCYTRCEVHIPTNFCTNFVFPLYGPKRREETEFLDVYLLQRIVDNFVNFSILMFKTKVGTIKSRVRAIKGLYNSCFVLVKHGESIDLGFSVEYFGFRYEIENNGPFGR